MSSCWFVMIFPSLLIGLGSGYWILRLNKKVRRYRELNIQLRNIINSSYGRMK